MSEVTSIGQHSHCHKVNMVVLDNPSVKAGLKPLVFADGLKAISSAPDQTSIQSAATHIVNSRALLCHDECIADGASAHRLSLSLLMYKV